MTDQAINIISVEDLRTQILGAKDLPVTPVSVPEWGDVTVYVRSMTAKERDDWQASYFFLKEEEKDGEKQVVVKNLTASLMVKMVCYDPDGKVRIFKDEDADALGEKSAAVISRLQEALRISSGTTKKDEEAILKNLEGQKDVSG